MTLADDKAAARRAAFERRKAAHEAGLDRAAQAHLADYLAPWRGAALAGYLPIRSEIDPVPIMAGWEGAVGVPVVVGPRRPLRFHAWRPESELVVAEFGVAVPKDGAEIVPDVLIVPLAAFDGTGLRLGYGGGFYDRTLEALRARGPVHAVGFAYAAQAVSAIPAEPTDQRLDAVVTETGALRFE